MTEGWTGQAWGHTGSDTQEAEAGGSTANGHLGVEFRASLSYTARPSQPCPPTGDGPRAEII